METIKTTEPPGSTPRGETVFRQLLQDIYMGRFEPGAVVNELELAKRLNISRGPVREAVQRLQGIGLITRKPFMKARVIKLGVDTMIELFEVRAALEGMACKLATERMSDQELDKLENALHAESFKDQDAPSSLPQFDFHARVAQGSGNRRLIEALKQDNYSLLRLYRTSAASIQQRKATAFEEHAQIVMAMKSRNAALAESLMRSHIQRASQHMQQQLEEV
ncbi:GntR family transcriptional regulator [Bordetella sp. H567]|uniref:GntR family transcriptional regulator n=1 Tax=Bordetella sp. H567 TaxID=1697043 RepID=UPI0009756415|nr:GntR family transcriptional regulator [Bordetella sp. H567]